MSVIAGQIAIDAKAADAMGRLMAELVRTEIADGVPCIYVGRLASEIAASRSADALAADGLPVHESQRIELHRPLVAGPLLDVRLTLDGDSANRIVRFEAGNEAGSMLSGESRIRLLPPGTILPGQGGTARERVWGPEWKSLATAPLTEECVRNYADLAQDWNPVHLDASVAQRIGLAAPIVHGMLIAGLVEPVLRTFGICNSVSTLNARFLAPVAVGECVTIRALQLPAAPGGRSATRVFICRRDGVVACAAEAVPVS